MYDMLLYILGQVSGDVPMYYLNTGSIMDFLNRNTDFFLYLTQIIKVEKMIRSSNFSDCSIQTGLPSYNLTPPGKMIEHNVCYTD